MKLVEFLNIAFIVYCLVVHPFSHTYTHIHVRWKVYVWNIFQLREWLLSTTVAISIVVFIRGVWLPLLLPLMLLTVLLICMSAFPLPVVEISCNLFTFAMPHVCAKHLQTRINKYIHMPHVQQFEVHTHSYGSRCAFATLQMQRLVDAQDLRWLIWSQMHESGRTNRKFAYIA